MNHAFPGQLQPKGAPLTSLQFATHYKFSESALLCQELSRPRKPNPYFEHRKVCETYKKDIQSREMCEKEMKCSGKVLTPAMKHAISVRIRHGHMIRRNVIPMIFISVENTHRSQSCEVDQGRYVERPGITGQNESTLTIMDLQPDENEHYERKSVYEQETKDHVVKMPTVVTARG